MGVAQTAIGVSNRFIVAHVINDENTHDGSIGAQLIQQVGEIDSIIADKGYDQDIFSSQPPISFEKVGKSTYIKGKMRLYLNLKKQPKICY